MSKTQADYVFAAVQAYNQRGNCEPTRGSHVSRNYSRGKKSIVIRLDESMLARLDEFAEAWNMSREGAIRSMIADHTGDAPAIIAQKRRKC